MQKILFGLVVGCLLATCVLGYIVISDKYYSALDASLGLSQSAQSSPDGLKTQLTKLQNEVNDLKDIVAQQSLFIQKLKEDNVADSAKVVGLEKKFKDSLANLMAEAKSQMSQINSPIQPGLTQLPSNPLNPPNYNNPVNRPASDPAGNEAMQKQREEQAARIKEQMQQRLNQVVDDFAKNAVLTDYQKQQFNTLLNDRKTKSDALLAQYRTQQITPEDFRTKREALWTDMNNQMQTLLTPQQYTQYQKVEPTINSRLMLGGGPMPAPNNPAQPPR